MRGNQFELLSSSPHVVTESIKSSKQRMVAACFPVTQCTARPGIRAVALGTRPVDLSLTVYCNLVLQLSFSMYCNLVLQLYAGDENLMATEMDYKKALDLLLYIDQVCVCSGSV